MVIEPRDAGGDFIPATAPISVVVMDAALPGEAAHVARWNFTAAEIAQRYRKTPTMEGFYLEVPWPAAPPIHSDLRLFVRYTTDDGRKLQAEGPIRVALAGRPIERWSAATLPLDPPANARPGREDQEGTEPPEIRQAAVLQRPVWSPERR